jgi:atlastin
MYVQEDASQAEGDELPPPPALSGEPAVLPPLPPSAGEAALAAGSTKSVTSTAAAPADEVKPFQHLQFLVRDWQNFDTDYEEGQDAAVFDTLHAGMQKYLSDVLRTRGLGDLQSTREQITRCFGKLDCFQLPHPGFSVTKKNYDGAISKIDPFFRALVNKYVRILFESELEAKVINGRKLSGRELQTYFEVYVKMFQAGQKSFPKAMTMLDATAGDSLVFIL